MSVVECKWKTCDDTFPNNYEMLLHVLEEHVPYTHEQLKEIVRQTQRKEQDTQPQPSTAPQVTISNSQKRMLVPPPLPARIPTDSQPNRQQMHQQKLPQLYHPYHTPTTSTNEIRERLNPHPHHTVSEPRPPQQPSQHQVQQMTYYLRMREMIRQQQNQQTAQQNQQTAQQNLQAQVQAQLTPLQRMVSQAHIPRHPPQAQMQQATPNGQMSHQVPQMPPGFSQMKMQNGNFWMKQPTPSSMLTPPASATHSPTTSNSSIDRSSNNQNVTTNQSVNNGSSLSSTSNGALELRNPVQQLQNSMNSLREAVNALPMIPMYNLGGETKPQTKHRRSNLTKRYRNGSQCQWEGCGMVFKNTGQGIQHYDKVHLGRGKPGHFIQLN